MFDSGPARARARAWVLFLAAVALGALSTLLLPRLWGGLAAGFIGAAGGLCFLHARPRPIPVLNYHSVSAEPGWLRIPERLAVRPEAFERQLAYLARLGYRSLFLSEAREILAGRERAPDGVKTVALTFDDGYADTLLAVLPLLERYGMKATLFVPVGFVGEEEASADGDWAGYLTWPGLARLRDSGRVEIQSHGLNHGRVFTGPVGRGFAGPGRPNVWLFWELRPERRRAWWRELEADRSLWGHPLLVQGPALACRAYRPDPDAVARLLTWAAGQGEALFGRGDWERRLADEWRRQGEGRRGGRLETDAEWRWRVEGELAVSRRILRRRLGVRADILCWPENAFSEEGERAARRAGFVCTVSNRHRSQNVPGNAPDRVARVFVGGVGGVGGAWPWLDFTAFVLELKVFEGGYGWYPVLAALHGVRRAAAVVRSVSAWRASGSNTGF